MEEKKTKSKPPCMQLPVTLQVYFPVAIHGHIQSNYLSG